jgi:7,8-dihydroneopterin 2',3'-cyclic phosphate phosphodiesterase
MSVTRNLTVQDLAAQIPAIEELTDDNLRMAVLRTWEASMAASPFDRIEQVPQSPLIADRGLLDHVNEVNERTINVTALARERFSIEVDGDLVLATAILHDVDKPLIFRHTGGHIGVADGTKPSDHGALGADLALAHGVPKAVADLVRVHSPFVSTGLPGTIEGTIVHYADLLANDLACLQAGVLPSHATHRLVRRDD